MIILIIFDSIIKINKMNNFKNPSLITISYFSFKVEIKVLLKSTVIFKRGNQIKQEKVWYVLSK